MYVCMMMQGMIELEVLGTCHSEMEKAAVLKPVHIQRYRLHVERGLSFDPPEVPHSHSNELVLLYILLLKYTSPVVSKGYRIP